MRRPSRIRPIAHRRWRSIPRRKRRRRLPGTRGDIQPTLAAAFDLSDDRVSIHSSGALLSALVLTRLLRRTGIHVSGRRYVDYAATRELRTNLVAQAVLVTAKIFRQLA